MRFALPFRVALFFVLCAAWLPNTFLDAIAQDDLPRILVFSKTDGFRHNSISSGIRAIRDLGEDHGFVSVSTEDADYFNSDSLREFRAVVFLNTTKDVLNESQQTQFEKYIQGGGGFVGIHAAADTEYDWPWYGRLVGAWFASHPNVQDATINVVDSSHPSTAHLPSTWTRRDEWYNYKSIYPGINELLMLDEESYSGGTNGDYHPIAWYHEYDGGRAFYTGLGHTSETFSEPLFLQHLLGGIQYAMGDDVEPPPPPPPPPPPLPKVEFDRGWNLIGLASGDPDPSVSDLFPDASSDSFFEYDGVYVTPSDSKLDSGKGYWLRFLTSSTYSPEGTYLSSVSTTLDAGWNLIAGPSCTVAFSEIDDPDDVLIAGTLYGFDGGYRLQGELEPGRGYWVRATSPGSISLECSSGGGATGKRLTTDSDPHGFGRIVVGDAAGRSQVLYFGGTLAEPEALVQYSMPPMPPGNAFDARFENGSRLDEGPASIVEARALVDPISIELDALPPGMDSESEYALEILAGSEVTRNVSMKLGDSVEVEGPVRFRISQAGTTSREEDALFGGFSLEQNYPNPFNPQTVIPFALTHAAQVRLAVYDVLGREVAVLVDEQKAAGQHVATFDASQLPTGVYIYRLEAADVQLDREMILTR